MTEEKEIKMKEQDWRGVLSLSVLIGFFGTLVTCILEDWDIHSILALAGFLSAPLALVLNWYFESKRK